MKIDFDQVLTDLSGNAIVTDDGQPFTLKIAVCTALLSSYQDETQITGEEKARRGLLALKIYGGNVVEVSVEEVALIKKLIGKFYGPLIVAKVWDILER